MLHVAVRFLKSAQSTVMGGENNNNNRVDDSLQLHEGLGTT